MAFVKKTWKDRIVQYANRRLLTKSGGEVEQVTVTRDEGTISEAGTPFNASNMNDLEERIYAAIEQGGGGGGSGTYNYSELINKPRINNNELNGNKSTTDLGIFGSNIQMSAIDTTKVADRILACNVQVYNRQGVLANTDGGTGFGSGAAMITLQNGIARIDFNLKMDGAETVQNIFKWGINRDFFTSLTGKQISPQTGGSCVYYNSDNIIYEGRTGLGGIFLAYNQFWEPARVYVDSGNYLVGGWASSAFAFNSRIVGTCYGTYT